MAYDDFNAKKSRNETIKMTALSQFLENQNKYKIELDDIVAIMTDLLLGGVDTVNKWKYQYWNKKSSI